MPSADLPLRHLVTGAGGFLGSHLVDALLAGGAEVMGIDSFITSSREHISHLVHQPRFRFLESFAHHFKIVRFQESSITSMPYMQPVWICQSVLPFPGYGQIFTKFI